MPKFKSYNRQSQSATILYETGKIINSSLDLNKILRNIVSIVVNKLKYDEFSILFLENKKLILKEGHNHPKKDVAEYHIKLGKGVTGKVAESGRPIIVNDVSKSKDYIRIRKKIKSELAVPIKNKGKVIGLFNVESRKLNAFNEHDLFILSALADQTAIAIQNAQTNESLKRSNKRLETINSISKIINSSLDPDTIFKRFLKYASKDLNYHYCALLMIEGNRLYSRTGIGFTTREIETYSADIGEGVCGVVAKTGKPMIVNDISKSSIYKEQSTKTRSEMAVPLKVEGKVLGVLNVESKEINPFMEEDLVYLSALSEQAAIAIRNAQLFNKIKNFNLDLKEKIAEATLDLREANQELERLNKIKSEFVSTVSHELRTPLTSIHGYSSLMLSGDTGPVTEEQKEFLGIVSGETQRLTRLINDLLDISKIESRRMKLVFDNFNLFQFMEEYKREIKNLVSQKNIALLVEVPKNISDIKADADKIRQILNNLIGNAIKFSGKGMAIGVKVKELKDHIQIDVSDHGPGISKKDSNHIFEKFYRVDNSMTRATGGTGLGLAITKHLVEAHRGKIWLRSKVGKGTTFSFTLKK